MDAHGLQRNQDDRRHQIPPDAAAAANDPILALVIFLFFHHILSSSSSSSSSSYFNIKHTHTTRTNRRERDDTISLCLGGGYEYFRFCIYSNRSLQGTKSSLFSAQSYSPSSSSTSRTSYKHFKYKESIKRVNGMRREGGRGVVLSTLFEVLVVVHTTYEIARAVVCIISLSLSLSAR